MSTLGENYNDIKTLALKMRFLCAFRSKNALCSGRGFVHKQSCGGESVIKKSLTGIILHRQLLMALILMHPAPQMQKNGRASEIRRGGKITLSSELKIIPVCCFYCFSLFNSGLLCIYPYTVFHFAFAHKIPFRIS